MLVTITFVILSLLSVILLIILLLLSLVQLILQVRGKASKPLAKRLRRMAIVTAVLLVATGALIMVSQLSATTPPLDAQRVPAGATGIAELIKVDLNGRGEWISLRGTDITNPVLLFLAGGPGGSQLAAARYELAALEERFVVVGWDQPGAAKSYGAMRNKDITPETYVEDGLALTEYLRDRFGQEKIYLVGESWGSALGVFLLDRNPDAYAGFIGTGQMVDFSETERLDYELALALAQENRNQEIIDTLVTNGPAPYAGDDMVWKSAVYLNYLTNVMSANPEIHNAGYQTLRDIASAEYGIIDQINYARGVITTFNTVYQQLYDLDLRKEYTALQVPVWFFLGRHDINAPTALVEEYVNVLDAPHKEIVWFEHSGHSPWIHESDRFVQEVIARFLDGEY